jgi:hypothetical protein
MPEARPFNAVPPFGIGPLTRVNLTQSQIDNTINILSKEDAVKLYWNIRYVGVICGFAQVLDECNPNFVSDSFLVEDFATLQPDDRIATAQPVSESGIDPEETDNVQVFGRVSFNRKPLEIFNTTTNEVEGYTLPSFDYPVPNVVQSYPTFTNVLFASGSNIVINHFMSVFCLVGTFNTSGLTNIDEISGDQRTYRNVITAPLTILGVDLTAVVVREGFFDTAMLDEIVLDSPCTPGVPEFPMTARWDYSSFGPATYIDWTVAPFKTNLIGLGNTALAIDEQAWTYE